MSEILVKPTLPLKYLGDIRSLLLKVGEEIISQMGFNKDKILKIKQCHPSLYSDDYEFAAFLDRIMCANGQINKTEDIIYKYFGFSDVFADLSYTSPPDKFLVKIPDDLRLKLIKCAHNYGVKVNSYILGYEVKNFGLASVISGLIDDDKKYKILKQGEHPTTLGVIKNIVDKNCLFY